MWRQRVTGSRFEFCQLHLACLFGLCKPSSSTSFLAMTVVLPLYRADHQIDWLEHLDSGLRGYNKSYYLMAESIGIINPYRTQTYRLRPKFLRVNPSGYPIYSVFRFQYVTEMSDFIFTAYLTLTITKHVVALWIFQCNNLFLESYCWLQRIMWR